jgi:hypothetical protein
MVFMMDFMMENGLQLQHDILLTLYCQHEQYHQGVCYKSSYDKRYVSNYLMPTILTGPRGKSIFSASFRELTDTRLGKEESAAADHML